MMIRNIARSVQLLFILACITIHASYGAETIFRGRAPSYAGEKMVFLTYSNMISFKEKEVASCMVNDSGDFECITDLDEIQLIFTRLGIYKCLFYAEPGYIYQLRLPEKRDKTEDEEMNPYFEDVSIHLVAKPVGNITGKSIPNNNEELNFLIRAFNDSFHPYYYKYVVNAYINAVDRQEIDEAVKNITLPYAGISNSFFRNYVEYRVGLLIHFGAQQSSARIITDYFQDKAVLYQNPAYMELFNEIFTGYFDSYANENPDLYSIINRESDLGKLINLLKQEKTFASDTLLELVMIRNFYDCFHNDNFSKSSIMTLLDSLKGMTSIAFHKSVITDIEMEIVKLTAGTQPPPFALYDKDSNLVSLDDFKDRYIYLSFCNSFSYYCIKEFELLRDLNSRHQAHLSIVTILVDDSFEAMKNLLQSNKYDWTFLHFSNKPEILDDYDIRTYPTYILIDPDGKLISSPAPSPTEGFEQYLFRIMRSRGDI